MKLKYPAEAFALGIVLFSRNMEEAFAAGILVILAVVFAEFLKNLLEGAVPVWSLRLCVLIGTGAIAASTFLLGFSALGIVREFLSQGEIFGNLLLENASFFSQSFQSTAFGFLAAGLALAFTNGILKKRSSGTQSLLLVVPAVIFSRAFEMVTFGGVIAFIWTVGVSLLLFLSVEKILRFSSAGPRFRGLPLEMLSMSFIYLILSIY